MMMHLHRHVVAKLDTNLHLVSGANDMISLSTTEMMTWHSRSLGKILVVGDERHFARAAVLGHVRRKRRIQLQCLARQSPTNRLQNWKQERRPFARVRRRAAASARATRRSLRLAPTAATPRLSDAQPHMRSHLTKITETRDRRTVDALLQLGDLALPSLVLRDDLASPKKGQNAVVV